MSDPRGGTFGPDYYAAHAERLGWGPGHEPDPFKVSLLSSLVRGSSVLDVACGPGVYAAALAGAGRRVVGVDGARALLTAARSRSGLAAATCADVLHLPFRDRAFDTTLLLSILEHVDDARLLREAARVTRQRIVAQVPLTEPGWLAEAGLLFSHWMDRSHLRTYSEGDLGRLAAAAGWRVVEFRPAYRRDITELYLAGLRASRPLRRLVRFALGRLKSRMESPPAECFVVLEPR